MYIICFNTFGQNKDSLPFLESIKSDSIIKLKDSVQIGYLNKQIINIKKSNSNQNDKIIHLKKINNNQTIVIIALLIAGIIVFLKDKIRFMLKHLSKKESKKVLENFLTKSSQKSNLHFPKIPSISTSNRWIIVGESVIGKSHIRSNVPCQDANFISYFDNHWGISIVCDGAGSAANSDKGASFLANEALPRYFKELVMREKWIEKNELPSIDEWQTKATIEFKNGLGALFHVAKENQTDLSSLACTAIVVIFSPIGLLVAHIGDGRAGFCDENGKWESIITPHKGEESNQTIFITSGTWHKDSDMKMSGVSVPECRIIDKKPSAFVLMSDGCEQHSFECSILDSNTSKWSDPNLPYDKFFMPLIDSLRKMALSPKTINMQDAWKKFLEGGTDGLKNESDDKTMILGILQPL